MDGLPVILIGVKPIKITDKPRLPNEFAEWQLTFRLTIPGAPFHTLVWLRRRRDVEPIDVHFVELFIF